MGLRSNPTPASVVACGNGNATTTFGLCGLPATMLPWGLCVPFIRALVLGFAFVACRDVFLIRHVQAAKANALHCEALP